jgi:glycosyltransferase involved in cell wall biosynthesis
LKVLFLTPAFPPFPGGGERYAQSLALQLMRRECAVTVVTSTARCEQDFWQAAPDARQLGQATEAGLSVVRCPLRRMPGGRAGLLTWRKAMVLISALPGDQSALLMNMARLIPPLPGLDAVLSQLPDRFDVIHAFNLSWEYPMIAARRLARRTGTPLVLTPFVHLGAGEHDRVARNSTMDHQLRMLREAKAVLTLTDVERQALGERGVTRQRIATVGGGLDAVPPLLDEAAVLAHYHLPRPFVVFIGRASYDKGAQHAAEAMIRLHRQGVNLTLALIGSSTPEFDRFLPGVPPADRAVIRPLGVVPEAHKHTLLQASTLLVLPSRTDSFGIVILEAWAHGKPVIGARAGGIPDVIDEGRTGLLVNFGDVTGLAQAIGRLMQDDSLCRELGRQGQTQLAAKYTWERAAERVLTAYQRVS